LALNWHVFDCIRAIFAVPSVDFPDLILRHQAEVSRAFRMEPATIRAGRIVLTHHEVTSERVKLPSAFAEVLDVLALVLGFIQDLFFLRIRFAEDFRGVGRHRCKEDLGCILNLASNVLLVFIFPTEYPFKESLRIAHLLCILLIAFTRGEVVKLYLMPGEVVLGEGDGPV